MIRILVSLVWILPVVALTASGAVAQDFRVLRETRPVDPAANAPLATVQVGTSSPRVLLAGDSWAQYMWDDGSHNDVFDRFGQADKLALSNSLNADPGPGYVGTEYAISGSEARQWADGVNYPWIANMVAALVANPTIDTVVLSIGGNDILAGKSGGGWYKDMDLDVPGSEAALLEQIRLDTFTIIDAALAVRPEIRVLISSYDYPNFNLGFWCWVYACPKRDDLSRDPVNDLITDAELNGMMVTIETLRIDWANSNSRVDYDNSVGLMHYFYGDGVTGPRILPRPGQLPPLYLPFPGGNPVLPTLRQNFRRPSGLDVDPIHLDYEGYQYKIAGQTEATFFPRFRGPVAATFTSQGGGNDGWADGTAFGTDGIKLGDNGPDRVFGILSFDTSSLPDDAVVTRARFYLTRELVAGGNPFESGSLGIPVVDIADGTFGAPGVEASDASALALAVDAGFLSGSALVDGFAVGVEIDAAALPAVNTQGLTQFRVHFPGTDGDGSPDLVTMSDGDAPAPVPSGIPTLAEYMGTAAPFLDLDYDSQTGVGLEETFTERSRLLANFPNPFGSSTRIRFFVPRRVRVRLEVIDPQGRRVVTLRDETLAPGVHDVVWDGRNGHGSRSSAGVYFALIHVGGQSSAMRMVRVGD